MRQETLEEAANKIYPNDGYDDETYCDFGELCRDKWLEGAKWVQERMYSEEEVEQLIHRAVHDSHCRPNRVQHANSNECAAFVNEWFEQFKKNKI